MAIWHRARRGRYGAWRPILFESSSDDRSSHAIEAAGGSSGRGPAGSLDQVCQACLPFPPRHRAGLLARQGSLESTVNPAHTVGRSIREATGVNYGSKRVAGEGGGRRRRIETTNLKDYSLGVFGENAGDEVYGQVSERVAWHVNVDVCMHRSNGSKEAMPICALTPRPPRPLTNPRPLAR